ncbi:unnamed protein product [Closterium sp. NIES-54]
MVQQVLQRFGFTYSSPQSTPLPTSHSLSAPPSDESVEPSGLYLELVGCLMYLMTCTRPDLAYPLSLLARYVAPGRHRKVHWDAAKRVLRFLCSTSGMGLVVGGRVRVVLTGHADASWELRWLTYLLTDLGEAPRSPPVLYVDNKAMMVLCQEHRLEHRTKHIALRYFLARELQHRGQLRLAYVASQANTADVFAKALQPFQTITGQESCSHQIAQFGVAQAGPLPRLDTVLATEATLALHRAEGEHNYGLPQLHKVRVLEVFQAELQSRNADPRKLLAHRLAGVVVPTSLMAWDLALVKHELVLCSFAVLVHAFDSDFAVLGVAVFLQERAEQGRLIIAKTILAVHVTHIDRPASE